MTTGFLQVDINKIQTIEEVKAVLKLALRLQGWDGEKDIVVHTDIVNEMPILNNLVKDKNT
jgi:hypothetical protein